MRRKKSRLRNKIFRRVFTAKEKKAKENLGNEMFLLFKTLSASKKKEDSKRTLELCNKIVELNLGLVKNHAKYYEQFIFDSSISFDDLFQEGIIGLMRAVYLFDYLRGWQLSTYAAFWIKQKISRFLLDYGLAIRIPINKITYITDFKKAKEKLDVKLRREPSKEELAEELAWPFTRLQAVIDAIEIKKGIVSLDAPISSDPEKSFSLLDALQATIEEPTKMDNPELKKEFRKEVNGILKGGGLSGKKIFCFNGYYLSEGSLRKIGKFSGITGERVRQINKEAFAIINKPENLEKLKRFV